MIEPTPARRRLLELVRRLGPVRTNELAEAIDTTDVSVRQHLQALAAEGLVTFRTKAPTGRGRPATTWQVTDAARAFLPDSHGELTVGLLAAVEATLGQAGLDQVLQTRGEQQAAEYSSAIPSDKTLAARVKALARLRERDGYMAEARRHGDGSWSLIEHHCPICAAAQHCQGICSVELDVFRRVLGEDVEVERTEHVLEENGRRCVYRIRPRG